MNLLVLNKIVDSPKKIGLVDTQMRTSDCLSNSQPCNHESTQI